jgi:hypothetical protein
MQGFENSNYSEKKWIAITKLVWDIELKTLIIKCMEEPGFETRAFSNSYNYIYYWISLEKFMKKYYNCKPEKPDKFIFLLLLTYPKKYIINLKSFLQLKIAFNEIKNTGSSDQSDFTCIGYHYSGDNNCICSQKIDNVFEFQNNLSGTIFNVGSVCNDRHRVISEDDENYKLMKRAERDRREENKNGLPEGYKEKQRQIKREHQESTINSYTSINDPNIPYSKSYLTNSICYLCNTSKIFSQSSNGVSGICSCIPTGSKLSKKKLLKQLSNKVTMINCINCNKESRKIDNKNDLCLICRETNKVSICLTCINNFTQTINDDCKFCNTCKPFVKKCLDCSVLIMYPEKYRTICIECFKNKKNNEITIDIICKECNLTFEVSQEHKEWRTSCGDCYKKNICKCENCDSSVKLFTVKKEGPNKGKKFYKCNNCILFKFM